MESQQEGISTNKPGGKDAEAVNAANFDSSTGTSTVTGAAIRGGTVTKAGVHNISTGSSGGGRSRSGWSCSLIGSGWVLGTARMVYSTRCLARGVGAVAISDTLVGGLSADEIRNGLRVFGGIWLFAVAADTRES
jgi:hypothetical protein